MKVFLGIVLLAAFTATAADSVSIYEQPQFRTATIYARNSDCQHVLFKLKRATTRNGNLVNVSREFTTPAGKVVAREHLTYDGNNLVSYDLDDLQSPDKGSAKVVHDGSTAKMIFQYSKGTKHKTDSENFSADIVTADMINAFLVAHWNQLMSGKAVKCRYIVLSRAETVGFEFTKQVETTVNGKPMVIVKMAPSSLIISALVDPLIFTIERNGQHRVRDYDGRTQPKIQRDGKLKDLDAITVFDW